MKWLAALLLLAQAAPAQTTRVNVMGLFRPKEFTVKPQQTMHLEVGGPHFDRHPRDDR